MIPKSQQKISFSSGALQSLPAPSLRADTFSPSAQLPDVQEAASRNLASSFPAEGIVSQSV